MAKDRSDNTPPTKKIMYTYWPSIREFVLVIGNVRLEGCVVDVDAGLPKVSEEEIKAAFESITNTPSDIGKVCKKQND